MGAQPLELGALSVAVGLPSLRLEDWEMSLLANDLCSLVPEWDIDWSDGSGACRYGDFVVVFDSGSNVIAYHVPDRADDAVIRPDLEDAEAWNWVLYNSERWVQVLSEPDFVDPGDEAWFRSELGLGV